MRAASRQRLVIAEAGDSYTEMFLRYGHMRSIDDARSRARLRDLGASESLTKRLMSDARREADALVFALRLKIVAVAAALRTHGTLNQEAIDAAIQTARQHTT